VVLTGGAKSFSAGFDLKMRKARAADQDPGLRRP